MTRVRKRGKKTTRTKRLKFRRGSVELRTLCDILNWAEHPQVFLPIPISMVMGTKQIHSEGLDISGCCL